MNQELRNFSLILLAEGRGIGEDVWNRLCDLLQSSGEFELLGELSAQVNVVDGRYCIK
jgi:hypothetical protein